ncbi:putative Kinesin motor domain-containing protein [Seiridium cardinale]
MDTENPINKPSGLPRPGSVTGTSRLPQSFSASTSHQALHEITESQTNTRSQYAMGPPSLSGIKRGAQGLVTQPDPKRKTLAERGGTEFPQATSRSGLVAPTPARNLRGTSLRDMQSVSHGFFIYDIDPVGTNQVIMTRRIRLETKPSTQWDLKIMPYIHGYSTSFQPWAFWWWPLPAIVYASTSTKSGGPF